MRPTSLVRCLLYLVMLSSVDMHTSAEPQKQRWKPNNNQLEFMLALQWDMTHVRGIESREAFYYSAYKRTSQDLSTIIDRMDLGLKDERNLPDLIFLASTMYGSSATLLVLQSIFPSIEPADRLHLKECSGSELRDMAARYANYLKSLRSKEPKY